MKGERPSLSSHHFYEPLLQYIDITNQSGSAKETVSLKIDKNVEMFLFVWRHKIGL